MIIKKHSLLILVATFTLVAFPFQYVQANETPYIVGSTIPVNSDVVIAVEKLLSADPPATTPYYAITYAQQNGNGYYVSVAGMILAFPTDNWSLENSEQVAWVGTLELAPNTVGGYDAEYYGVAAQHASAERYKTAAPNPAPGGGSYIAFPWEYGKSVVYGPLGVHGEGGYGTSGMYAIDLVVGDSLGSNIASATVYAADAGTIDYVCNDTGSVAVRTVNATTGDIFLYAHFIDNANLIIGQSFERGEPMGTLKYGTFEHPSGQIDCGWASQPDTQAHLHWMFDPENGYFQAEQCFINVASSVITCPGGEITPQGALYGGGGAGTYVDGDTAGEPPDNLESRAISHRMTFFDYIVLGALQMFDRGIVKLLPSYSTASYDGINMILNTAKVVLNVAKVLLHGNINIGPLMAALFFMATTKIMIWTFETVLAAWKLFRILTKPL